MEEIFVVYLAWRRLRKMRASNERWSEADYVASVYVLALAGRLQLLTR